MKRHTNDLLDKVLKRLLRQGEIVIGKIRVTDGENVASYTALSACPPEHQEGYCRALETVRDVYIRDVVYEPVYFAIEHAKSIASLE
jgi:hypothetical protein